MMINDRIIITTIIPPKFSCMVTVIQKNTELSVHDRLVCSEMFAVGFFNGSIGSWDPVERLKPTVLHELMEPTRGSQRKQMDFVCERRREPRAVPGWPLPVKAQMLEEG